MSTRAQLISEIRAYTPVNEQEARDRETILMCLVRFDDVFERTNALCHMTASAWTVNPARTKVLMAYHSIYDSWAWLGGHADGETDLAAVALREVMEESGIARVRLARDGIYSLEVLTVDGHEKRGAYVASHLHLNVTYLAEADDSCPVRPREGENTAVRWFTPEDAINASTESWFRERIYSKLVRK